MTVRLTLIGPEVKAVDLTGRHVYVEFYVKETGVRALGFWVELPKPPRPPGLPLEKAA